MNTSAGIVQQLFKLVKLQIETAGDGKNAEAVLSAITVEEAERIRAAVFQQKAEQEERGETAAEQEPMRGEDVQSVYRLSVGELLMAASTSGGSVSSSQRYSPSFLSLMKYFRWTGSTTGFLFSSMRASAYTP